jgi:chromosome segregation ATPase
LIAKEDALESLESRLVQIDRIQEYLNQDLEDLEVKFNEVMETRTKNGGKYLELEAVFKECSNSVVKLKTKLDLTLASMSEEQTSQANLIKQEMELDSNMKKSMAKYEKRNSEFRQTKEEYEQKVKQLQKSEELLETLSVGLAGSEGQDNGYMDQLKGINLTNDY